MTASTTLKAAPIAAPLTNSTPTSVHFFTGGCGDMLGFTQAGFLSLYAANHHPASVETARNNWPGLFVNPADVRFIDMRCVPLCTGPGRVADLHRSVPGGRQDRPDQGRGTG
jgi:DNA (cytosine-5)-methyltransferase 1